MIDDGVAESILLRVNEGEADVGVKDSTTSCRLCIAASVNFRFVFSFACDFFFYALFLFFLLNESF